MGVSSGRVAIVSILGGSKSSWGGGCSLGGKRRVPPASGFHSPTSARTANVRGPMSGMLGLEGLKSESALRAFFFAAAITAVARASRTR
jgi:hypothetical protein